jgi:hypothetical protein
MIETLDVQYVGEGQLKFQTLRSSIPTHKSTKYWIIGNMENLMRTRGQSTWISHSLWEPTQFWRNEWLVLGELVPVYTPIGGGGISLSPRDRESAGVCVCVCVCARAE